MLDEVVGEDRAPRDFRAKFPDDVLQENLAGQLWFGAEVSPVASAVNTGAAVRTPRRRGGDPLTPLNQTTVAGC